MNIDTDPRLGAPWRESAARLVQILESTVDDELCLAVLKQLNRRFGEQGYPGFLKLLLVVAESGHTKARRRLADVLALGLRRGDVPSGVLTSWGGTHFWSTPRPSLAGIPPATVSTVTPRRQLDPIEYLSVWFSQRTHRQNLGKDTYRECLIHLLDMFNSSPVAQLWYPLKIEADLAGIEGAFTRQTRQRLSALVDAWKQRQSVAAIADAATTSSTPPHFWTHTHLNR